MTLTMTGNVTGLLREGRRLHMQGDRDGAMRAYQQALALDLENADTLALMAGLFREMGEPRLALESMMAAIRYDPDTASHRVNLGSMLMHRGEVSRNVAELRRALQIAPTDKVAHENLIFALDHDAGASFEERIGARHTYRRLVHDPIEQQRSPEPFANDRSTDRRLKVGYVSADFRAHSMASHLSPMLKHHDRERFAIHLFSNRDGVVPAPWAGWADDCHAIGGMPDAEAEALIRDLAIDILVDCSQYTGGNRLTLFALRPAPVQVTGWGFIADTMGLGCFDAIALSRPLAPLNRRAYYSEPEILHLPSPLLYEPFIDVPLRFESPAQQSGYVTFGYLGRTHKLNAEVLETWAQILLRAPGSRILLKCPSFDDPYAVSLVVDALVARGISDERIDTMGKTDHVEHAKAYGLVDIALDPWPQNGGVTVMEAMYCGVPTITRGGERPGDRLGATLCRDAGQPWHPRRMDDPVEYVENALDAARMLLSPAAATIRRVTHEAAGRAPFMQYEAFTRSLEDEYRRLWRKWVYTPT